MLNNNNRFGMALTGNTPADLAGLNKTLLDRVEELTKRFEQMEEGKKSAAADGAGPGTG